jgi:hypothetical protein
MKYVGLALVLMSMCAPVAAQSAFIGTWQVESTPPWTVVIRADGSGVTGRVSQCTSRVTTEIFEGHVDGNTVTFKCRSGDADRTVTLTGTLNGNEIVFVWDLKVKPGGSSVDASPRNNAGILGPSSPPRFTAKRVPDGPLALEADRIRGVELAEAVNLIQQDVKGEGVLFLPRSLKSVRGIIVGIAWGLGNQLYDEQEWQALAETLGFGFLRARIRHISEPNAYLIGPGRIPADGGVDVLKILLQRFAEDSGHPEIANAPLLFWGHSAAAAQVTGLAAQLSQRTIGIVRYHSGTGPTVTKVLSQIPALILNGEKEETGNQEDAFTFFTDGRALGAPWTFGLEPNATHQDFKDVQKATAFMKSWITAVVGQRLSPDGKILRTINESAGWMGDNLTGEIAVYSAYRSTKVEASWLPDGASARAWRLLIGR